MNKIYFETKKNRKLQIQKPTSDKLNIQHPTNGRKLQSQQQGSKSNKPAGAFHF